MRHRLTDLLYTDYAWKWFTLYDLYFLLHYTETGKLSLFAIHPMYVLPALLHRPSREFPICCTQE